VRQAGGSCNFPSASSIAHCEMRPLGERRTMAGHSPLVSWSRFVSKPSRRPLPECNFVPLHTRDHPHMVTPE
jgi:hypothetical protein